MTSTILPLPQLTALSVLATLERFGAIAGDITGPEAVQMMREKPREFLSRMAQPDERPLLTLFRFHNDPNGLSLGNQLDWWVSMNPIHNLEERQKRLANKIIGDICAEFNPAVFPQIAEERAEEFVSRYFHRLAGLLEVGAAQLVLQHPTWQDWLKQQQTLLQANFKSPVSRRLLTIDVPPLEWLAAMASLEAMGVIPVSMPAETVSKLLDQKPDVFLKALTLPGEPPLAALFRFVNDPRGLLRRLAMSVADDESFLLSYIREWFDEHSTPDPADTVAFGLSTLIWLIEEDSGDFELRARTWADAYDDACETAAKSFADPLDRVGGLVGILDEHLERGHLPRAFRLLSEMLVDLQKMEVNSDHAYLFGYIIDVLDHQGLHDQAQQLLEEEIAAVRRIEDTAEKARTLFSVARILKIKDTKDTRWKDMVRVLREEAMETASRIEDELEREELLEPYTKNRG